MAINGKGIILRVYVGENDKYDGKLLYEAIVHTAKDNGLAGATVLRGIAGFGDNSSIHTTKILRMAENLPVVIEIIDTAEKIKLFIPVVDEMIAKEGLLTVEDITIIGYQQRQKS
ncbi:MAG: DUF190 domain-containing protein [candidate division Zixibacteria bacterium]|nr:DUF190 domain-containing protein [candidate division Zixibacteria bacterium]